MKSLSQPDIRQAVQRRIAGLPAERPARWGRMSAPQMVSHLIESMRMATGDLPVASKRLPVRYPPLKQLIIYWLPFPKGAPTAPELIARTPEHWPGDINRLLALIDEFAARNPSGSWPEHPAFGRLSGGQWAILAYRHIDHHLRQFGA
jgi:hypothetical protein